MTHRLLAVLAAFVLVVAACGDDTPVETVDGGSSTTTTAAPPTSVPNVDPDSPEARLAAARARWAEEGPSAYRLTMRELCFCPETVWTDTVAAGEVLAHEAASDDNFFDPGERTMEDLFDDIEDVIDNGFVTLDLDFDEETGALVRYWVDVEEMMADEEHGVEVVAVEPIEPLEVVDALLEVDYPCGFGFAYGSIDQTLGLYLYASGFGAPDVSKPIELPAESWTAELRVGRDLFANHCDDVIDTSEPEPVVDEIWVVTAGTLVVEGVGSGGCGSTMAAGILTGAVIESPDGATLELGDVELRNDGYGCVAG
jgi:hypothetical protein